MFALLPLAADRGTPEMHTVLMSAILLTGVIAASGSRRVLAVSLAAGGLAVAANWAAELSGTGPLRVVSLALSALFMLYVVAQVFRQVRRRSRVDFDTLIGGICIYLLLVILFSQLHTLVDVLSPGAYLSGGAPLVQWTEATNHDDIVAGFIYFSLTTITTLGYGDILPEITSARMLAGAEAILGQLYLALFIGRLVGLYTAQTIHDAAVTGGGEA
jgi:hypothetical protein